MPRTCEQCDTNGCKACDGWGFHHVWTDFHWWPFWLTIGWWRYVLDDSHADHDYGPCRTFFWVEVPWTGDYLPNHLGKVVNWLSRCKCRWQGHPAGVYFYNLGGYEPDMRCQGCGEDIG